ncbi:50S ribosomal protein L13 [Candidatus Pacearchaeota archaeon]|jgi:ribosomal protein uL13|nr:50S ribosomal protein L13 [Candidatus Pacearchaeota archaeon]
MKIIDGQDAVLGRLASYAAKEVLKGEDIIILNCEQVIITGNKKNIEENFKIKRSRVGSSQKGPKHSKTSEKIVKRTIRGMLPDHRKGRGKIAYKKIKCYVGIPKEFQDAKKINLKKEKINKSIQVKDISIK